MKQILKPALVILISIITLYSCKKETDEAVILNQYWQIAYGETCFDQENWDSLYLTPYYYKYVSKTFDRSG